MNGEKRKCFGKNIQKSYSLKKKNEKIIICDDSSNNYASSLTHDNDDAGNKEN